MVRTLKPEDMALLAYDGPVRMKFGNWKFRKRVAAFDYDHTLVQALGGKRWSDGVDDWEWTAECVPEVIRGFWKRGWCIVVFTNQEREYKLTQIRNVIESLGVPVYVFAAMSPADKKPSLTMWKGLMEGRGRQVAEGSFYCGDQGGRPGDRHNRDRLFAERAGIKWVSPESVFRV